MEEKNTPIVKYNNGTIGAAIFKQQGEDGKNYYSVCMQRSYKKKGTEEWIRESVNMFPDDMLKAAEVLRVTYNMLVEYLHKNKAEKQDFPKQAIEDADNIPF
jgi:hypothetical protein